MTVFIRVAWLIAIEEMAANVSEAASGEALKVIITIVISDFVAMQAFAWMDTGVSRTTKSGVDTVIVVLTE